MPIFSVTVGTLMKLGGAMSTTTRNIDASNKSDAMKLAKNIVELAHPNAAKVLVTAARLVKK